MDVRHGFSGLTIGKVTQCITRGVLVLSWRRRWERDYYHHTKAG